MKHPRSASVLSFCLAAALLFGCTLSASAASCPAGQNVGVYAAGRYVNWDGVSNAAQFKGADGELWYAVDGETAVTVYRTKNGRPVSGSVTLKKPHPLFGTVLSDEDGSLYLITGEKNETTDTSVETVFISKFDRNGRLIKTVGDNGGSSLAYYYGPSFFTRTPFNAGNCDAAIFGDTLTVFYARSMYSGHQSCSVLTVDTNELSKVNVGAFYESHSFAQRVVPTKEGFVYVSEGDCYDRAFAVYSVKLTNGEATYRQTANVFDFWVEDGALDAYNMHVVNNNFAHMGGLAALPNGRVAFAATSVPSLNSDAEREKEQIFIQIFDPYTPLDAPSAFVTKGERSGLAGNNGRTNVTNYGVKWLTSYAYDEEVDNVQIVSTDQGEIVVLYELRDYYGYNGVWYIVLDENGIVTRPAALFSADARLNPCETPVYANGAVYWVGNEYGDNEDKLMIYRLPLGAEDCSVTGDHIWNDGKVTKKAACTAEGEKTFTCTVCGAKRTEPTEKAAHSLTKTAGKAATCTKDGNAEYYTCSVCKKTFADAGGEKEIEDATLRATGHSFGEWTVAKKATADSEGLETRACSVCGEKETRPIPKAETVYTRCDADGDGRITSADARLALRRAVGLETCQEGSPAFLACDADGDGSVTAADARLILRAAVGLDAPAA